MRPLPYALLASLVTLGGACDHYHSLGWYDGGVGEVGDGADSAGAEGGPSDGDATEVSPTPTVLPLAVRHLAFDPGSQRLFATVGGGVAATVGAPAANSLVVIDAPAARVLTAIPVGIQPTALALSDDGTTAWVGIDAAGSVRKVDLRAEPPAPGPSFVLPTIDPDSPTTAASIWVLQGTASTIAVSLKINLSPSFGGVAVFDDGVARQERTPPHTGAATLVRGQAGWLYGVASQSTGAFFSLSVTAAGVTQKGLGVLVGVGDDDSLVYAGARVYGTSGPVVDVSTPTKPTRVGTFAFTGAIAPVPTRRRAFMISPPPPGAPPEAPSRLRVLDTENFVEVSGVEVPGVTAADVVWDLIQTSDGQLVFLAGPRTFGVREGRIVFLPVAPLP